MPEPQTRHAYRFIRAHARYVGQDQGSTRALILRAQREAAPADAYAVTADGRWLTVADLETQAVRGSVIHRDLLSKVREYAGVSS